jgi:hypothetical protein
MRRWFVCFTARKSESTHGETYYDGEYSLHHAGYGQGVLVEKERTLTMTDVIDLKTLKELATTAQIVEQMFALNREGLIVFGKDELEFPQPDHPKVRAWRNSRAGVTEDQYRRGWLPLRDPRRTLPQ